MHYFTLFVLSLIQVTLSSQQYVLPADTLPPTPQLPPPYTSGYVNLSDVSIWQAQFGPPLELTRNLSINPIVFLHGGFGNSDYWGNQIARLLEDGSSATIIAIDTRAQGRSYGINKPLSYDILRKDVLGVLDHFNISKASIVGWSDGAITGYDIAIHAPHRLDRLFAFAGQYSFLNTNATALLSNTFSQYLTRAAQEYQRLSPTPNDFNQLETKLINVFSVLPDYMPSDFARIPTLYQDCQKNPFIWVVDAADEEVVNRDTPTTLHNWIPASGLAILPSTSHFA